MRVWFAQMEILPGNPAANLKTMQDQYILACRAGAEIVLYPEMCVSGYLLGDLWEEKAFVRDCMDAGIEFASNTGAVAAAFGNVHLLEGLKGEDGRPRKVNAVFVAQYGRLVHFSKIGLPCLPKSLMPNYREFDDSRHFYSLRKIALEMGTNLAQLIEPVELDLPESGNHKVGFELCEDGWDADYGISPSAILAAKGAEFIANLSASPFTRGKSQKRHRVFATASAQYGIPILYNNKVGVQNNGKTFYAFDGQSGVYHPDGNFYGVGAPFEALGRLVDLRKNPANTLGAPQNAESDLSMVTGALQTTLKAYLKAAGLQKVVIGASGGIDSAVAASLFASILPPENLLLVNMPSQWNSQTTIGAAEELAKNLGCFYTSIPIGDSVALTKSQIDGLELQGPHSLKLELSDFALENVQARDRSSRILAACAAAFGGVFSCNANKAEMTVGYSTLYGDHGGFFAPLADLWKHQVYELGRYLDQEIHKKQVIPETIYAIIPSAELSPRQAVDAGLGDPLIYWYHDRLFRAWVEQWDRANPEDLLVAYFQGTLEKNLDLPHSVQEIFDTPAAFVADLEKWWKLFRGLGVVKRVQSPPVAAVSRRAYGFDYRESILQPAFTRRYEELKRKLLA